MDELHPDHEILAPITAAILESAGGLQKLTSEVRELLRECFDGVIKTPKTARRLYDEIEKTEKTYIGTCVEIDLRHRLKLARGKVLD
ncbi:MAG: NaeI family type II restriction endonuclease, partial [Thermoanaerobaculia bacterium]